LACDGRAILKKDNGDETKIVELVSPYVGRVYSEKSIISMLAKAL